MKLLGLSCRPGEEMAFCKPHGHRLQPLTRCSSIGLQGHAQLEHSQIRISGLRSKTDLSMRSRSIPTIYTILQKKLQPGVHGIARSGTALRPSDEFLRRREVFCCESVVDSSAGVDDPKADERVEDGSILTGDGSELRSTVRLVECAMLAATAGLAYFLSNLLRIEAYFGCFFPLPVVISSMRWGAAAGRKTMVATAMLLLILSGPLKAASYLLMHGFVGLAMGAFWKWNLNWGLSIAACTVVRCLGALGFVLMTSWLLRDNLLALITMNAHASLSYVLAALGINLVPTMPMIYVVFATLLVMNCGSFVFLLHVLYAIFLRRLGLRGSYTVPGWVERAI